jgi:hypothetical protein
MQNNLKDKLKDIFNKQLQKLDLSANDYQIQMKLDSISQELFDFIKLQKDKMQQNNNSSQTKNDTSMLYDDMQIDSNISKDISLDSNYTPKQNSVPQGVATTIPDNFTLTYDMKQYALFKFVNNAEEVFEHFKLHYQSTQALKTDWVATWKIWVLNQTKYNTNHLIKTTIDENLELDDNYKNIAKKYLTKEQMEVEFVKFKNYYIANGDIKVHSQWEKVWENWCINFAKYKPKEQSQKSKDKADYRWDFRKAKETSDKIKDWLEFEKGIRWLEDFYLKDIPLPGIGWSEVIHPDYNKEEILLYKIDSPNGQYMLNNKKEEIVDVETFS